MNYRKAEVRLPIRHEKVIVQRVSRSAALQPAVRHLRSGKHRHPLQIHTNIKVRWKTSNRDVEDRSREVIDFNLYMFPLFPSTTFSYL